LRSQKLAQVGYLTQVINIVLHNSIKQFAKGELAAAYLLFQHGII
jgi:hypothetical protein